MATATNPPAGWLTIQEAADITKLSHTVIRRELKSGAIRGAMLGRGSYRIRRADLEEWFDRSTIEPGVTRRGR
jgi:excisionase family DNA binding protein